MAVLRSEITANAVSANSVINTNISANVATLRGEITSNISSVFGQANAAYAHANAAYANANSKFSSSGGTISGSVYITQDLNVTGNLTIGGNTTSISANNLEINDSIIYLANNNSSNIIDIGLVGHFISTRYQHTGVVRDHNDGTWKFFSNVITEPSTTVNFDANTIYDKIKVGGIDTPYANVNGTDILTYATSAYSTVNTTITNTNSYISSNVATLRGEITANAASANSVINTNISANVATLRGEISSNVNTLNGSITANAVSANSVINTNISANVATLRGEITANAASANSVINTNISANVAILRGEISANAVSANSVINTNISANVATLRGEITANAVSANAVINTNISSNVATLRGEISSNVSNINGYITANAASANSVINTNISANVIILRGEISANADSANSVINSRITSNITTVTAFTQAAFDKANTGPSTSVSSITANSNTRITQSSTSGNVTFDLATINTITPGSYTYPSMQVDAYGRTTTISSQTPVTSITSNSSSRITQSTTSGPVTFDLAVSGVTAGTYGSATLIPTINVDDRGRVTYASNNSISTTINLVANTGTGTVSGGGTLTINGSNSIATTVSSGTYTITNNGILSFNTRTGAVTLSSSDVTTALGYTPVNKTGDTLSGNFTGISNLGLTSATYEHSFRTTKTFVTSSTAQVSIDSFDATVYRSAKYYLQMTSGSSYHVIELSLVHNGTSVYLSQYGEILTTTSLGTFDSTITGSTLNLYLTATNAVTTVKLIRDTINI